MFYDGRRTNLAYPLEFVTKRSSRLHFALCWKTHIAPGRSNGQRLAKDF